jgi:hypothetical protein
MVYCPREHCITGKELSKLRRRIQRRRTGVACHSCRLSRTRCTDQRPCVRCMQNGLVCTVLYLHDGWVIPPVAWVVQ